MNAPLRTAAPAHAESSSLMPQRVGIDTHQEPVVYMRADCPVCRSEGFEAAARVRVCVGAREVIATLNVVYDGWLAPAAIGLSESAWNALAPNAGDPVSVAHAPALDSLSDVRQKVYGHELTAGQIARIVHDVAARRYSDLELAAFIAASAGDRLSLAEIEALTVAMVDSGERLRWPHPIVADKHCVGGLPGNRTTLIVVPIVTALGLTMPKTSSRAITSPAGTADTMEMLAPVNLTTWRMRHVVEQTGGCIVWGDAVQLSPADDVLIRVERALDLDSEGQLVASVLSKKAAAGSTHVVVDIPVGPTAKVRSERSGELLGETLRRVGERIGLHVRPLLTDGRQPVGRGLGPALEARDVLAVLQNAAGAPADLRERALLLSGELLELAGRAETGRGAELAAAALGDGRAWRQFSQIAQAQGGLKEPPMAPLRHPIAATRSGRIAAVDNRRLAKAAKLAGAPGAPAAGAEVHARIGDDIRAGQPLFTLHAETLGELRYALDFIAAHPPVFSVEPR